jgi:hypothetical protein
LDVAVGQAGGDGQRLPRIDGKILAAQDATQGVDLGGRPMTQSL